MSEPQAWQLFEVREAGQTEKPGFQRLCVFQEGQGVNEGVERDKLPVTKQMGHSCETYNVANTAHDYLTSLHGDIL